MERAGATDVNDLCRDTFTAEQSGGRRAVYRCGCRSEIHHLRLDKREVSMRVSLLGAVRESGMMRSD